jgi:hypothetical protein
MSTFILKDGIRYWGGSIDAEGHFNYKLKIRTASNDPRDGPNTHLLTPGLPLAGSIWLYENIPNPWAWCDGSDELTPVFGEGDQNVMFDHTFNYSTKPRGRARGKEKDDRGQAKKCADQNISNPLAEPDRTSGGTAKDREYASFDKDGRPIFNTAFEPVIGSEVEFDKSRGTVTVEQNRMNLELKTCQSMVDTLNDSLLWDLPSRSWKLSDFTWERKLYGTCSFYYTRRFVFESKLFTIPAGGIKYMDTLRQRDSLAGGTVISGWDKLVLEQSSLALHGEWLPKDSTAKHWTVTNFSDGAPDKDKPEHYVLIPNPRGGGNVRMVLSATTPGVPLTSPTDANYLYIKKYPVSNFLLLGIPTSL